MNVSLTQAGISGNGVGQGKCTGGMESYAVIVAANGQAGFSASPAQASAEAVIRELGTIVDEQAWTRQVNLTLAP